MTDEQLELLVPSLKEGRPNTYTYTKALAEQMLIREAGDLPLAIFRPAIVVAAYQEPFPVSSLLTNIIPLLIDPFLSHRDGLIIYTDLQDCLWQ